MPNCVYSSSWKASGIFAALPSQEGFESDWPGTKFQFFKIDFLRNFPTVLESLFNKVPGLNAGNFIKKRLQRSCFPVNIAKFLRITSSIEHLRWLLLSA